MQKTLFLVTCLLLLASPLTRALGDENAIYVRFDCLAWDTIKANGIQYFDGETVKTLRVGQSHLNGPYAYTGPNPIVFFRETEGAEPGTIIREPVATAYIKSGLQDVLILFSDAKRSTNDSEDQLQPKLETVVMNNDFGAFPLGSFRMINLSEHAVGCILGEKKYIIPGKQTTLIKNPVEDGADMRVHFSMKIDDQWEPKINTGWMFHADKRSLVFLTDVINVRRPYLKIKTITD